MNETLTLHPDGRTTLRLQRRLPHPPEKVWRAITRPEHLAAWFPAEVTFDGDRISYGFGPGGRILVNDPPHVFAHTWDDDELRWELQPDGEATLLTFTHTFTDHHGAASFAAGWHVCLMALLAHLDQRPAPTGGDSARLHEDFVAILGLTSATTTGTGTGTTTGAGAVRVERQLTRPADDLWRRLGGDQASPGGPPPAPFTPPGLAAGAVTRVESGKLLEFGTPGGHVRWELAAGTGHGARLVITCTGDPSARDAWRSHVERLASSLVE
ncbi:toxin-antitoxin system toxin subunit [Nonomuraea mesophila]|uniref:Toxin-antitoxin system toxin subunit n=1 Tax=Nonomuraea mesophila TaxID=2530382 RepID=A0A4R5E3Q6_9ACTN|nr:SRPBCC domain-containing protein [Nonomuraea mesophila]TDE19606.1 toxin-antitoxin system toxin subunit [Nonomuraea mesophila]